MWALFLLPLSLLLLTCFLISTTKSTYHISRILIKCPYRDRTFQITCKQIDLVATGAEKALKMEHQEGAHFLFSNMRRTMCVM